MVSALDYGLSGRVCCLSLLVNDASCFDSYYSNCYQLYLVSIKHNNLSLPVCPITL